VVALVAASIAVERVKRHLAESDNGGVLSTM